MGDFETIKNNSDLREAQLAKRALDIQSASNLSGVVHSFSRDVAVLWDIARVKGEGTRWVNEHPVCKLYIDKLSSLAGTQYNSQEVFQAFAECEEKVKRQDMFYDLVN